MIATLDPTPAIERLARLRRCLACGTPAERSDVPTPCPTCGRVAICPPHTEWSAKLKGWCAAQLVHRTQHAWLTDDELWRRLLVAGVTGAGVHYRRAVPPHPPGLHSADDAYPVALQRMQRWIAAGCPLDRTPLLALDAPEA